MRFRDNATKTGRPALRTRITFTLSAARAPGDAITARAENFRQQGRYFDIIRLDPPAIRLLMSKEHAVPKSKISTRKYGAMRAYAAVIAACLGNT
jgi:hypothetical protein